MATIRTYVLQIRGTAVVILEAIVKETGPTVVAEEKPPAGQIGPDAAIPA